MLQLPHFPNSFYNPITLFNILPFTLYNLKPKVDTCGILTIIPSADGNNTEYILSNLNGKLNDFSSICRASSFGTNEYCTLNNAYVMSRGLISGLNPNEIKENGTTNKIFKVKGSNDEKINFCWTKLNKADDQYGNHHYFSIVHINKPGFFDNYQKLTERIKSPYLPTQIIKLPVDLIDKTLDSIKNGKQYANVINMKDGTTLNTRMTSIFNWIANHKEEMKLFVDKCIVNDNRQQTVGTPNVVGQLNLSSTVPNAPGAQIPTSFPAQLPPHMPRDIQTTALEANLS
jgi:hypothetical protein